MLNDLIATIKKSGIDVLLPVSGPGIAFVARHAAALREHVHISAVPLPAQLDLVNDKWLFAQQVMGAQIATPRTVLLDGEKRLDEFDPDLPIILKPRCGSGGNGINRFDRAADLRSQIARFMGENDPYLIQEFITGYDIDRSVLCIGGRVVASTVQEDVSAKAHFAPSGSLHFHQDAKAERLVDAVVDALGWHGIAHLDLRYDKDGRLHVIELNPRYWSTMPGSLAAGINFPLIAVREALGLEQPEPHMHECYYVSLKDWPKFRRRLGVSLSETSLYHGAIDPVSKLLKKYRPSSAFGENTA